MEKVGSRNALDQFDRRILDFLQSEGRITNLELAERVGLSPAPCLRRVRSLEGAGIIRSYVALVDAVQLGLGFEVIVDVRLKQQTRSLFERFEKRVLAMPEVVECCLIAGDWDYHLRVVASDIAGYQSFILDRLMSPETDIASYRTTIIMQKVKSTTKIDASLL